MATTGARRAKIVKWGNGQAIRLSKSVLQEAQMREGEELVLKVEKGRIALEPAEVVPGIAALVSRITPRNIHKSVDWGRPVGNELW